MWGTVGLIYNHGPLKYGNETTWISDEEASSWELLRSDKVKGKVLMKDAFRDIYTALLIGLNKESIDKGEKNINDLAFDTSDESIALVENYLNSFKESICGWEADFGKEQMTKGLAWVNLSWSGDAQWAIEEAAEMGLDLRYRIPQEGSAVWFDGWVIPKYAKNVKAASYFINFMCKPENALRNMDMTGYVSAVGGDLVMEEMADSTEYDPIDVRYFFGEEADSVCVNPIMYPDNATISRCAMMHDTDTEILLKMWSRVKGDNADAWTYIIICIVLGGLITFVVLKYVRRSARSRKKHFKRKS